MAWIESHQELGRHPKLLRLADRLGISKANAVGHLHYLWWWAMDFALEGNLTRFEPREIAEGCQWEGNAAEFIDALVEVGFLDRESETNDTPASLWLHDWEEYTSKFQRTRKIKHQGALKTNHTRWHVARGVKVADCPLCQEDTARSQNDIDTTRINYRERIEGDSLTSPPANRERLDSDIDTSRVKDWERIDTEIVDENDSESDTSLFLTADPSQTNRERIATVPTVPTRPTRPTRPDPSDSSAAAGDKSAFISRLARAYEENVGMLTPHLADEFRDFEEQRHPPESWGEEAVHEAATHNKRSWAYVRAVLRRWCEEGRGGGNRATEIQEPYNPGIEVEPGIFMRGDFFPYTDPRSPHHHLYKPKPVLSEAEGDSSEHSGNGGDHQQNYGGHPQDGSDHE